MMTIQLLKNITKLLATAFFLMLCHISTGQSIESIKYLKQLFAHCDSIVLISHVLTYEHAPKELPDWDSRDTIMNLEKWKVLNPPAPKFLINGKLNRQIIWEVVRLNDSNKIRLSSILLRRVILDRLEILKCDQPQHSIVFYKGNTQSYIDICFGCKKIHSSKDIDFDEINLDKKKWAKLSAFFKSNGLTKVFDEEDKRISHETVN